jgi:hypothetical protein
MTALELTLVRQAGPEARRVRVGRMINAGFTGRNAAAVQAHIQELAREGIAPPPFVPMLFPIISRNLVVDDAIEVVGEKTSGEAEVVFILDGDDLHIGVGSDHTDRELEAHDVLASKQACPNVISRELWDYRDVADAWDGLILQSWVTPTPGAAELPYQRAPLATLLPPVAVLDLVRRRTTGAVDGQLVVYGGTIPLLTGAPVYGSGFRCELLDSRSGRALRCAYAIRRLAYVSAGAAAAS